MKNFLFAAALLACATLPLSAQEKGATPLPASGARPATGVTRAVVIGISNYEDERIPDLQYAHRDAEAFAEWLQSAAGGAVPEENISLYTDREATLHGIGVAIGEITRASKAGDRAIIYLSGHGDVETDGESNLGFFLAHDSPYNVYWSNAINLRDLQYLTNSMAKKGVQVLVVSDACRSGKLAGSDIGGPQATASQLATQFSNAIVLLSCQPDEFSHESEQWGGGRGLFSYHLENALYGMADQNRDLSVDLREVRNHLEERVPAEASPNKQTPMVQGLISTRLATVDPPTLAQHQTRIGNFPLEIKYTGGKTLAQFPDSLLYHQFLAAIEAGRLMAPAGESANDYYDRIVSNPEWEPYHGQVKRKFVVALADEAQLVINKLLRTDPKVADEAFPGRVRYAHLPAYLARATEILGPQHYLYRYLKAKQYYFEAKTYTKALYPGLSPDSIFRLSQQALDSALIYDPEAAYVHLEKGVRFFWDAQPGVAAESFDKALSLSPAWVLAIYYYARAIDFTGDRPKAVHYLKEALRYDSTFLPVYERLGYMAPTAVEKNFWRNEYVRRFKEWEERDSEDIPPVYMRYMGLTLHNLGRNEEAEKYLLRGAEMTNWEDPLYYKQLGMVYEAQGRHTDMCRCTEKFSDLQPYNPEPYAILATCWKTPKLKNLMIQYHQRTCVKNHGYACGLYRFYHHNHQFDDSRRIGQAHIELVKQDTLTELPWLAHDYWYYGSAVLAESTLLKHVQQVEASGDSSAKAALKNKFGPFGQLVMANLAQGDVAEAEYWFDRKDRMDESFNPILYDGWGFGLQTWLAYVQGNYPEADSLIEIRSKEVPVGNLIEDMLLLISICGQVDYAIFCLDKAMPHYPERADLLYHLARLYLEQKNDYAKGVHLLERAVLLDNGSHAPAHYHLAATYAHLGKNDAALDYLEKALELGYDDREGIEADARWEGLRGTERYRGVMGKYFGKN